MPVPPFAIFHQDICAAAKSCQTACLPFRCFAMEEDREFVYLALERCKATLAEAMQVGPCHLA